MSHETGQGLREDRRFGPMVGAAGGDCREHLRLRRAAKQQPGQPVLIRVLTWVAVGPVCYGGVPRRRRGVIDVLLLCRGGAKR
ncbi:hypothetical protein F5972_15680 [Microbispora cellulosiformans]|uniref:Uncharacterized protein n=1 Tax=Microbispora cellulosiformans TaxID=2614688 RepID=A0A5J5K4I4_9ACTN|nr:hypothetical protein [Microbispora cellulosiformans]KAA9378311.1 hypothetical protein F5972_15680 [Microbispora cellulosiformans]